MAALPQLPLDQVPVPSDIPAPRVHVMRAALAWARHRWELDGPPATMCLRGLPAGSGAAPEPADEVVVGYVVLNAPRLKPIPVNRIGQLP